MILTLIRKWYTDASTVGELYVDGVFECYTLEDMVRAPGVKIPGRTAIPAGVYTIEITESPRFKMRLPILLDVPMFTFVRMHAGNDADDTEACILVGKRKVLNMVLDSRAALAALLAKMEAHEAAESAEAVSDKIKIVIINEGKK